MLGALSLLVVVQAGAHPGLRLAGDWSCPAAPDVLKALSRADHEAAQLPHLLTASREGSNLDVSLLDATGATLGEQRLPVGPGSDFRCSRLAGVVAVLVQTWEQALGERIAQAPPPASPPPPVAPVELPPLASPPMVAAVAFPSPSSPRARRMLLELSAGGGASVATAGAEGGLAPELVLGASVRAPASRWDFHLQLWLQGPREGVLGPGQITWLRTAAAGGAGYRLRLGPAAIDLTLDAALAWLHVGASRYSINGSSDVLDPGVVPGARLSLPVGGVEPWLGAWAMVWPLPHPTQITGSTFVATLPQVEVVSGVGVAVHLR